MRLIGWLCVIAAPLAMTLGVLAAQTNNRVYGELCGQGRIWACGIAGAEAARMWLMVAVGLLAYGMLMPHSARHADATPLVAIVIAIVLARFVVGLPLTPLTGVLAAFGGSLWAALAQGIGIGPPSIAALLLVLGLRSAVRRVGSRGAG